MIESAFLATAASLAQPGLAVFEPLVGQCWRTQLTAANGPEASETHCFTASYNFQHVCDTSTVVVAGKTVYSGQTFYNG
jgi:hypothetical protein